MKSAGTLAQTVFSIALIAFIALIVFIFSSTATARTPSLAVAEPGAIEADPVYRTPSLEMAVPLDDEIVRKAPLVDIGFHPFDSDPTRKSLIWNAFPEPLNAEFFEKAPLVDMGFYPLDVTARVPSVAVREPLNVEIMERLPSDAVRQPMQTEVMERLPSDAVRQPMQTEVMERLPSDAVRQPMQVEVVERMPSEAVREPLNVEIMERLPSDAVRQPMQTEVMERMPSEAVREPLNVECCGPTMRFDLKEAVSAEILIYSVDGRLVRRLSEALPSGDSSLTWDGRDDRGSRAASGVYFARVQANGETGKGKLVLVR